MNIKHKKCDLNKDCTFCLYLTIREVNSMPYVLTDNIYKYTKENKTFVVSIDGNYNTVNKINNDNIVPKIIIQHLQKTLNANFSHTQQISQPQIQSIQIFNKEDYTTLLEYCCNETKYLRISTELCNEIFAAVKEYDVKIQLIYHYNGKVYFVIPKEYANNYKKTEIKHTTVFSSVSSQELEKLFIENPIYKKIWYFLSGSKLEADKLFKNEPLKTKKRILFLLNRYDTERLCAMLKIKSIYELNEVAQYLFCGGTKTTTYINYA